MAAFWSNCNIKAKLLLGIGVILAIFALSSILVLSFVNTFARSADLALNHALPMRKLAQQIQFRLTDADDVAGYYIMDRDSKNWPDYLKTYAADIASVKEALPAERDGADNSADRQTVDAFATWLNDYLTSNDKSFELKRSGRYDAGVKDFVASDSSKGQGLIQQIVDSAGARAATATAEVEGSSHATVIASIAGAVFAVVAGLLIAFALGGSISKRLQSITKSLEDVVREDIPLLSGAMAKFAAGDLSARVTTQRPPAAVAGNDETAMLTRSYNNLVGGVKAFGAELSTTGETLDTVIGDVKQTVDAAAGGDFSMRLDASRQQGVFRELAENLNRLMDVVSQTVSEIKETADVVSTSAREISSGNADLSQRTEEQAASLEETAASMEELTATVRQNADNARQANDLAIGARDIAIRGGDVVGEVVNTMVMINESGKKIVDIIGVIDGIAFQTNILALNAAVEAARAGEQGRGFAVVAGEVRTLAQRSAAAAKEIKALIGDSVEKTSNGTRLVGQAGDTMAEIVTSVKRVTDIVSSIAAASVEQGAGIEQVNSAVTQMDTVTQQNSALVEEIAASSGVLEERARGLVDYVSRFVITQNGSGRPPAKAPAPHAPALATRKSPPATTVKAKKNPAPAAVLVTREKPPQTAAPATDDDAWSSF